MISSGHRCRQPCSWFWRFVHGLGRWYQHNKLFHVRGHAEVCKKHLGFKCLKILVKPSFWGYVSMFQLSVSIFWPKSSKTCKSCKWSPKFNWSPRSIGPQIQGKLSERTVVQCTSLFRKAVVQCTGSNVSQNFVKTGRLSNLQVVSTEEYPDGCGIVLTKTGLEHQPWFEHSLGSFVGI